MAVRKGRRNPLTPRIRQEVTAHSEGFCECHNPSHKHIEGHLKCPTELGAIKYFHPKGVTLFASHDWEVVCKLCRDLILSSGGEIYR
jgi:hypothetical protein